MLKIDGQWQEVDWQQALAAAAKGLKAVQSLQGPQALEALASPLHAGGRLLGKLMRGLGSEDVDCHLRQADFRLTQNKQAHLGSA
jgi:NADH-quinone oxidoreductase subunit G